MSELNFGERMAILRREERIKYQGAIKRVEEIETFSWVETDKERVGMFRMLEQLGYRIELKCDSNGKVILKAVRYRTI